jgi:hypothetical protein
MLRMKEALTTGGLLSPDRLHVLGIHPRDLRSFKEAGRITSKAPVQTSRRSRLAVAIREACG